MVIDAQLECEKSRRSNKSRGENFIWGGGGSQLISGLQRLVGHCCKIHSEIQI